MDIDLQQLRDRYASLSDEELGELAYEDGLTESARLVLSEEFRRRGLSQSQGKPRPDKIPPIPQAKPMLWLIPFVLCLFLGALGPVLTGGFTGAAVDQLAQALGAGLGLLLFSAAVAFPLKFGVRIVWRPLTDGEFVAMFTGCVFLLGAFITAGHLYNHRRTSPRQASTSSSVAPALLQAGSMKEKIDGSLYRNETYRFRIRFPEGWKIMDADGKNIVKKAEAENWGSLSILVQAGPTAVNSNELSDEELTAFGEQIVQPALDRLSGKPIEVRVVHINNQKALHLRTQVTYKRLSGDHRAINDQYLLLKNGLIYLLTASVRESEHVRLAKTLKKSVDSFVIEDWQ